ncbi:hypothetical protein FRC04_002686 [Tulasnella sp. 424]|nr:hypothetical protein FRC04_002686 [Tulasnella sp. 424]
MTLEDTCGPVWEYSLREQPMMMDMDDGFVLWTSICKALGKSKADITRMIESDQELQQPNRLRRVKGGFLRVQGTWIPHSNAKALARKIAWEIKDDLVPFFGQDFPSTCLSPNDPGQCIAFPPKKLPSQIDLPSTSTGFADILAPRTRARRGTTTAVPGSQPSPSANSPSQMQGQPWLPSSPPAVPRQNSTGAIMNSYPAGFSSPPRANRSPSSNGSPHMQPPHGYQPGAQSAPQGRYSSASGTASPGHTIREEQYGPEGSYPDTTGPYSATPGFTQYSATGYQASSAAMYTSPPASAPYFQPQYSQSPYGTQAAAQPYNSQVTTPTQTGYPSAEYNYVSHGVSDGPPQPYNTYQEHQDQNRAPGYALTSAYPTSQQPGGGYQGQYQPPSSTYPSYANESSVRYTAENPYSNDTARYGNESGSSRAEYGYNYGNGSPGMQGQPGQRTHQQPSQYGGAEYRDQQAPGQQPWGGYGSY